MNKEKCPNELLSFQEQCDSVEALIVNNEARKEELSERQRQILVAKIKNFLQCPKSK